MTRASPQRRETNRVAAFAILSMAVMMCGAGTAAATVDLGLAEFRQGRFAEAFQDWSAAAAAGSALGALYVGVLYDSGLGVAQDYGQAMTWYRRAADAGSAAGSFNVAVLYDAGLGVRQDRKAASIWYGQSAARGYGRAEYNLAMLYETGTGVPRSRDRAVALYRSAFSHGIQAARAHLTQLGEQVATETAKQDNTGLAVFERAQQVLLARGVVEAGRAIALFRQAADQHNPLAEYDLAYCYERGVGVARDPDQAYGWYQRAAADATDNTLRSIARAGLHSLEGRVTAEWHAPSEGPAPQTMPSPATGANRPGK